MTPWLNDSLALHGPERLLLDGKSAFAALDDLPYRVRWGFGYGQWEKEGLSVTAFVPVNAAVRIFLIENHRDRPVHFQYFLETEDQLAQIRCEKNGFTVLRKENGEFPQSQFRIQTSSGEDPFRGLMVRDSLCLVIGDGAREIQISPQTAKEMLEETKLYWRSKVCPRCFASPWTELNDFVNGWALYQVMACRILGRSSVYQSGGAYGFRDQLQDVCAVFETAPELAKSQILLACAHQYREGDVQHWWHVTGTGDRGVRTRCSDDLLWLPYTVAAYLEAVGDKAILQETAPYLCSAVLAEGEDDRYEQAECSPKQGTVLEHCLLALDMALQRGLGAHGLPLIGSGDWNDGYSHVGRKGKGESVWLAWFQALVLKKFLPWCPEERKAHYEQAADNLISAASTCWDGDRFIRGYFDDGSPLGGKDSPEGSLDSLAQSFAVFAGCPDRRKVETALRTAVDTLFDREQNVVRLLDPPFSGAEPNPGYISRYPEGVRENGGQYTHAAIWLAMACFECGMEQEGQEILLALLPRAHPQENYRVEPYVLAADVYAHPQHKGRGGWTWYTGAAGWYWQAVNKYLSQYFTEASE